jgi:hypothetical protein
VPEDAPRAELFRPAAVAAHRGTRTTLATLPSSRRVTTGAFWAALVAVLLLAFAGFSLRVDETSTGVWAEHGEYVIVGLPIGALDRLRPGQPVRLGAARGVVYGILAPISPAEAQVRFGPLPTTLRGASAVALIEVRVTGDTSAMTGKATVRLGRRTLIAELVPALRHDG